MSVIYPKFTLMFVHPVTSIILQKNGAGLHTASSCFWDNSTDGKTYCKTRQVFQIYFSYFKAKRPKSKLNREIAFNDTDFCFSTGNCTVRWENKTIYCIVSVFGLAIWGWIATCRPVSCSMVSKHFCKPHKQAMMFLFILNKTWIILFCNSNSAYVFS